MNESSAAPSALRPGLRLDRYELLTPIAEGGMASVWIARLQGKRGFEKLFAVKTILAKHAQDPRFEQMFLDEARIASAIEHVNVAQILELGEEHGVLFLVMEYVDGESLSKLQRALDRRGLSFPHAVALRILADACAGLHAAHELRDAQGQLLHVVHRDVSPQNLLVTGKGFAKLVDFGIAKARDRLAGETNTGALKGKVHYMAPEQARGEPVDRRADIWAIGAVLYHLLTGVPPYDADNQLISLHMLTSKQPPSPLPGNVPPPIANIVNRALAFDPADRYATAAEMQHALEAALGAIGATASDEEVGAFVREYVGDRLDERRAAIQSALAASAERGSHSGTSDSGVPSSSQLVIKVEGATSPSLASSTTLVTPTTAALERRSGRRVVVLGIGALAVAAAALVVTKVMTHDPTSNSSMSEMDSALGSGTWTSASAAAANSNAPLPDAGSTASTDPTAPTPPASAAPALPPPVASPGRVIRPPRGTTPPHGTPPATPPTATAVVPADPAGTRK